ncbi:hypothetical protein MZD04_gp249 [Pseudomonas phage Psa21]|uniref:Virion structural protein n=1 Tax=Pseudomonas phage Psa21 TaxID=2530023 RepID=A0A481W5I9_9CAUD|nr:hypothetical protein MZD04_gp249 [Pseudomonas phage Psa21]QBJ02775.1 hypothetical protein PSA21_249 [Pseudomonas phage Psa21]
MNKELNRWLVSNEQVYYTEQEINQLVNKPLDPQGANIEEDNAPQAQGGLKALISTADLPKNPKEGESYQVGPNHWVWANGRWMTTEGLYGH